MAIENPKPDNPQGAHGAQLAAELSKILEQREHTENPVEQMAREGWAKEAPTFSDQINDPTRTTTFRYIASEYSSEGQHPYEGQSVVSMSEHEGLVALDAFLAERAEEGLVGEGGEDLSACAADIRANLAFIGEPEYKEAIGGIKALWQKFLDENPSHQIYLVNTVSEHEGRRKSDTYLAERVLAGFTDEERARYAGRIATQASELTTSPADAKIVMVDDWTMTGRQLSTSAQHALETLENGEDYRDCLEVNLIAAAPDRIENGLPTAVGKHYDIKITIPVRAYYRSRTVVDNSHNGMFSNDTVITGLHSSGDYGFEFVIAEMVAAKLQRGEPITMPPLTNIVREYRYLEGQEPAPQSRSDSEVDIGVEEDLWDDF